MTRKASPLSSSFIGNFTWSYIFIHHMICVLLGASFYFVSFCLILFRIMFCISIFKKKSKDSLYHAYFASIHVAVSKQKVYRCCKKFPRIVREWYNIETFCILSYDNIPQCSIFLIIFGVREVWLILHSLQTILFCQIAVMFALFAHVCLFNDSIW